MKSRVWMVRMIASFALILVAAGTIGCGSSGAMATCKTYKQDYKCMNNACACSAGPNKDNSCCNPEDNTCAAEKKCNAFCKYCAD